MTIVERTTELPAPADAVWRAVQTPSAFRTVTRRLISMPVIRSRQEPWRQGETVVGWVLLFGVVPFARHHLHVARVDEAGRTLRSEEHGGLIRRWNHDITVTPVADPSRCEYRDRIDIDAGLLTPLVAVYARWFYRVRQARWRTLATELV